MRTNTKKVLITVTFASLIALSSSSGFADPSYSEFQNPNNINPGAINPSGIPAKKIDYDAMCDSISQWHEAVYSANKLPTPSATLGSTPDITAQDYCNLRGVTTGMPVPHTPADPASVPGSLPSGGTTWMQGNNFCTLAVPSDGSCPGRELTCQNQNGDTVSQESCQDAKQRTAVCKLAKLAEDQQILTYCKAHKQANKAKIGLTVMASVDTAAAALCLLDAHMVADGMKTACGVAAIGAGAGELGYTLGMTIVDSKQGQYRTDSSGNVSDTSKGVMNGLGIASKFLGSTTGIVLGSKILNNNCEKKADQADKDQADKDQAAKDQAAQDQAAKDQAAKDQAAQEQAAKDQAAKDAQTAADEKIHGRQGTTIDANNNVLDAQGNVVGDYTPGPGKGRTGTWNFY